MNASAVARLGARLFVPLCLSGGCAAPPSKAPRASAPPAAPTSAPTPPAPLEPCVVPRAGDEDGERAYHGFFQAVARRFATGSVGDVEACCQVGHGDRILAEYCSAASALLTHEKDDVAFLNTMPVTPERIESSNELDLLLSDFETAGPEPFERYFQRAWRLAHDGNEQAVEAFVTMFENSHGVFAEAAESSLCPVFKSHPALFERLRVRHPAAVRELTLHCLLRL